MIQYFNSVSIGGSLTFIMEKWLSKMQNHGIWGRDACHWEFGAYFLICFCCSFGSACINQTFWRLLDIYYWQWFSEAWFMCRLLVIIPYTRAYRLKFSHNFLLVLLIGVVLHALTSSMLHCQDLGVVFHVLLGINSRNNRYCTTKICILYLFQIPTQIYPCHQICPCQIGVVLHALTKLLY